jgi:hypothetical protein
MGNRQKRHHKRVQKKKIISKTTNISKISLIKKLFTKKRGIELLFAIASWGGGDMLGHISIYLKVAIWFVAFLLLMYFEIPFKRWIIQLLKGHYAHLVTKKKTMQLLGASPVVIIGVFLFVFAYYPTVALMTPKTQSTQSNTALPTFYNTQQEITISFGNVDVQRTVGELMQAPQQPFTFTDNYKPITIYIKDGKLCVDCSLYGGADSPPASISDFAFTVKPTGWDDNSDDNAFEVVNQKQQPVLQEIYETNYHVIINGYFYSSWGVYVANEGGNSYFEVSQNPQIAFSLKPIFKYPSSGDNQGVRRGN